ncbi:unnamed protein product [Pedinophyceae sp. YPF-701]|nr:unnamed protein product [Pedinophyceae sp. YPF-701]
MSKRKNKQRAKQRAQTQASAVRNFGAPTIREVDHPDEAPPKVPTDAPALFLEVLTSVARVFDFLPTAARRSLLRASPPSMCAVLRHCPVRVHIQSKARLLRLLGKYIEPTSGPHKAILFYDDLLLTPYATHARALYEADREVNLPPEIVDDISFNSSLKRGLAVLDASKTTDAGIVPVAMLKFCAKGDECVDCGRAAHMHVAPAELNENARLLKRVLKHQCVAEHVRVLQVCHHLETPAMRVLVEILADAAPNLTKVAMQLCDLGDAGVAKLAAQLARLSRLRHVDLSGTCGGPRSAAVVVDALRKKRALESLSLNFCRLGATVAPLAKLVSSATHLAGLALHDCGLTAGDARTLVNAVVAGGSLTLLDLGANPIGDDAARYAGESLLTQHSPMEELRLANCSIRDDGAAALAGCLATGTRLRKLDLSDNLFGDAGAHALATGLRELPRTRAMDTVDVSGNRISMAAAMKLGQACGANPLLRNMELVID